MRTRMTFTITLLAVVTALLVAGSAAGQAANSRAQEIQDTVTLTAVADATVRSWQPDTNFGSDDYLELSYDASVETVTLLRFDLASVLPADAIIDSAILELFLTDGTGADPVAVAAYFVTSVWAENSVTWNTFPTADPMGIVAQVDNSPGSYKSWDVTGYAQAWLEGANNGLYLRGPTDGTFYGRTFESREHLENVPRLVVDYHTPTATPTNTPTSSPTNTPTATSTSTVTPTPTPTPTPPEELPDLVITNLWNEGSWICCQVQNLGPGTAPGGHIAALFVHDELLSQASVDQALAGGERWEGCFPTAWECSLPDDPVAVQADHENAVNEADETNNTQEEVLLCDTAAPVFIDGPSVDNITADSAVVSWQTDEESEGAVRYGSIAGRYPFERWTGVMAMENTLSLTDLEAATTYHLVVEAFDPYGNASTSREVTFETLPPVDNVDPVVSLIVPQVITETVVIEANVSDNTGIERVEFYLDGVRAFTDYAPPYQIVLNSRQYANGEYTLTTRAFDLAQRWAEDDRVVDIVNLVDVTAPVVTITSPVDDATVSGIVTVTASLSDDAGLLNARFYLDGVYFGFEGWSANSAPKSATVTLTWDTRKLQTNKRYRLAVEARDTTSKAGLDTVDVWVQPYQPPPPPLLPPDLIVTGHTVSRSQNKFTIELRVKNVGEIDASNVRIMDRLRGFQPIASSSAAYDILTDWDPKGIFSYADVRPKFSVPAGQERIYTYTAIPVMVYPNPPSPQIGYFIDMTWDSTTHQGYHKFLQLPIAKTTTNESIPLAHSMASASSNYLIVTNPYNLFAIHCPNYYQVTTSQAKTNVNTTLSTMAELAWHKNGVLGYLYQSNAATLRSLVKPGGDWVLKMHLIDFNTVGKGYLLIVGETNIIGSYWSAGWDIKWSNGTTTDRINNTDQPIANTSGDKRPELILGRIIGDTPTDLTAVLRRSIQVFLGTPGHSYDHSHALSVSGTGDGLSAMVWGANQSASTLTSKGYSSAVLHWKDIAATQRVQAFANLSSGRDIIHIFAHGNPNSSGALTSWNMGSVSFGNTHPFVLAASCSTGNYVNGNFAETFFDRGAGVYIGSLETSHHSINSVCGKHLYGGAITADSVGKRFTDLERSYWDMGHKFRFWVYEYNLYGDPKYGGSAGTTKANAATPIPPPPSSLTVNVPDYTVTTVEGLDFVEISGGSVWMEPGEYQIPFYTVYVDVPPGTQVQSVTLAQKSDMTTDSGLHLPVTVMDATCCKDARLGIADEGTLPFVGQDYAWYVVDNPDGSAMLIITMYPFTYNPLTTNASFYQTFRFDIAYTDSPVSITRLQADAEIYRLGTSIHVDLDLDNVGEAQDVVINASVKRSSTGEVVSGLLLHTLRQLEGSASFSSLWESEGFDAGDYEIELVLQDLSGTVLDRQTLSFNLGLVEGEITDFTVGPENFSIGDPIHVSLTFLNTGDVPATGKATIRVSDKEGNLVSEFSHDLTDLAPSQTVTFNEVWQTESMAEGRYYFTAAVIFNGTSTDPMTAVVSTEARIYLPVIVKN